jgi:hypothetical protein
MDDDAIFWDRLAEMPFEEHEQECVLRRERVIRQIAMLREKHRDAIGKEANQIGAAIDQDNAQLSRLNERIKYLRRLMDTISWKNAVKKVLGEEVYEQLIVWRVREEELLRASMDGVSTYGASTRRV